MFRFEVKEAQIQIYVVGSEITPSLKTDYLEAKKQFDQTEDSIRGIEQTIQEIMSEKEKTWSQIILRVRDFDFQLIREGLFLAAAKRANSIASKALQDCTLSIIAEIITKKNLHTELQDKEFIDLPEIKFTHQK